MLNQQPETQIIASGPEEISDLKRALNALVAKQDDYTDLFAYYDGEAPLVFTQKVLADIFKTETVYSENWSAVVIDSELERIRLREFDVPEKKDLSEKLRDIFVDTELNLDADDVHLAALVCGEAFVFAWKDDQDDIEAYYHDPRLCHIFYDPQFPRRKKYAAKWWVDEDKYCHLYLYYDETIKFYKTKLPLSSGTVLAEDSFMGERKDEANPFGVIPIFHFRPDRRKIKSRLTNVIKPQNAVNKLFNDMMVVSEYGAFPQRYIISSADVKKLKNAPNEIR